MESTQPTASSRRPRLSGPSSLSVLKNQNAEPILFPCYTCTRPTNVIIKNPNYTMPMCPQCLHVTGVGKALSAEVHEKSKFAKAVEERAFPASLDD